MTDIISTLGDEILCHILSFLQTKQSVATTILSKRWNHLYLSVPNLYFLNTITDQDSNFNFNDFISSVLLSRDVTFPIKSFHLDVTYEHSLRLYIHNPANRITKWVNFVLQRGVEVIQLRVEHSGLSKLPVRILNCRTLVVLKLSGFKMDEGLSSVVLPSLKTLHLEYIWLPSLRDLMLLLIGCPILEDFFTFDVTFDSKVDSLTCNEWKSFCIRNLTRVNIDCARCFFPLEAVHNVPSMRLEINEVLYYDDLIPTFHNLTQLELVCHEYSWKFLVRVLSQCPKLQKLYFYQFDVDYETYDRNYDEENGVDPDVIPQSLLLNLRTCKFFDFFGLPGELMLAKYISKNARVLQSMEIWDGGQLDIEEILSSYPWASSTCKFTVNYC